MKLLLHAGPMKTGSTAFQEFMFINRDILAEFGIRFRWLKRWELEQLSSVLAEERGQGWPEILILSHECLCRISPNRLHSDLSDFPGKKEALMVARPLREVYPSLYLQNLKGHVMRSSSYEEFLSEQMDRDRSPSNALRGQIFNYHFLEQELTRAGFIVHWVKYSRSNLLYDLIAFLKKRYCLAIDWKSFRSLPPSRGSSPRRSLDFGVAPIACQLNKLCKTGSISVDVRAKLVVSLLEVSDHYRDRIDKNDAFCRKDSELLDGFDFEINQQFWNIGEFQ